MALVERIRESSPSPPSSSTSQPKYDVFLSFRGEDTRTNFTDHLYVALKGKGIITFRDEKELKKGECISELFKAIEESQFAIIIFSRNYASSTWCLDELVKIIKCEDEIGLKVFPVFYNVSPSVVRNQTEPFEQAFIDHQNRFEDNIEKVNTWRDTLKKVADIKGWDLHPQRLESEIIENIVKVIMEKLSSKSSRIDKNLIGVKSMVAKLIPSYLGFGNEIYMMGICGMGGLGKTTLAHAIYEEYSDHFEGSTFIANVREISENGKLHELQQQLLDEILGGSNKKIYNVLTGVNIIKRHGLHQKKVLLVLDDVNHKDQLEKLAGAHDWFGLGSWIIITTRDEHVLVDHGVFKIYKPNGLVYDDASKLFCLKAFKNVQPKEGYMQLSKEVVGYASGLPLALVTLGSFLAERNIDLWKSALEALKKNLNGEIFNILKISYDGLEEMWKEIFLDIACFFRWRKKDKVIEILENCGLNARIGISVLVEKSLLTIDHRERLTMHDLLQEMGKKIVCQESGGNLGKQSRLWLNEDLLDVLENKKATEAIQAIVVLRWEEDFKFQELSLEGFSKMSNFRLLVIDRVNSPNDQRHLALPNNLRYLYWESCPLKCLASSHKQKMALVHLEMWGSKLEYLWKGKMRLANLKSIVLNNSENLIRTPDVSDAPILELLDLSTCSQLVEIHPSIGRLKKLRYLSLHWCASLTNLPSMSAEMMQSLTVLDLSHCYKINSFPKFTGIMKSLSRLNLAWTAIEKVEPSSIECLTALAFLDLSYCTSLECLPSNFDTLKSLEILKFSQCPKLKSLPRLPSTIRFVDAKNCSSLKWSPERVKLSAWSCNCMLALNLLDLCLCTNLECLPSNMDNLIFWSQPFYQWLPYDESCSRVGFTILFHFLQGLLCRKAILDGSIIPSFLAEIEGNSITIELPSNWYNSKWIGFALWASLPIHGRYHVMALGDMPQNHCASEVFHIRVDVNSGLDSICLLYLSRDDWFAKVGNGECSQIKVIFKTDYSTRGMGGKCGVSLIYKQGVAEFNETNAQCLIKSFGEVSIYKLTAGDDDDVHIVDDDDDDVYIVGDDDDNVLIVGGDDFDDDDI